MCRIVDDTTPLPADDALLDDETYVEAPIKVDYGTKLKYLCPAPYEPPKAH